MAQLKDSDNLMSHELDGFDLLGSGSYDTSSPENIAQAVSGISARFQKRLDDHRQAESQADRQMRQRQLLLLTALMRARKIAKSVVSLQVSKEVKLILCFDDFQGWPRVTFQPLSIGSNNRPFSRFEITGSDRTGLAEINLLIPGRPLREGLVLSQEEDMERLPRILKRFMRHYFDILAEEILAPPTIIEEPPISEIDEAPVQDHRKSDSLSTASVYEEGIDHDILERLPEMTETRVLRGLD